MADIQVINGNMAAAIGAALCRPRYHRRLSHHPPDSHRGVSGRLRHRRQAGQQRQRGGERAVRHERCHRASLAGSRVFTASASQGLSLMYEPYFRASTLRLPVVMAVANREMISPQTLWGGPQDSLTVRDAGWLQDLCGG